MKKLIAFILAVVMLMSLCACGSDNGSELTDTSKLDTGKNAPSEDMVLEDITAALQTENEYATITGVETVKSLSEDGSYDITLNVTAETKYADWTYEADMSYTKYDQGWMVDDVVWISSDYQQVRTPDIDTMVEYASDYIPTHEYCTWYVEHHLVLPMENPIINFGFNSDANNEVLELCWNTTEKFMHNNRILKFSSLWEYDALIDNWTLIQWSDDDDGYYYFDYDTEITLDETLDFSGEWHIDKNAHSDYSLVTNFNVFGTIIISNFSWEEFDVSIPGLDEYASIDTHFTRTIHEDKVRFSNKDGAYIDFISQSEKGTRIVLYLSSGTNDTAVLPAAIAHVRTELPPL